MRIDIDFVAGSHGNYLAFVLNKLLLGDIIHDTPFIKSGASHTNTRDYQSHKIFFCDHYSLRGGTKNDKVISITFEHDDLLPLTSIALTRAGDLGIEDKNLHVDTFNKLNNLYYKSTLDNILLSYNELSGYDDIKAEDWPNINDVHDFYNLPNWIIEECKSVYGFSPRIINESNPDIQRSILREFFKIGFKYPEKHGFSLEKEKMVYSENQKVYKFDFIDFYDLEKFKLHLQKIKEFFNLIFVDVDIDRLHTEFLSHQPYKNIKNDTDALLFDVINGGSSDILDLTLFQESYLTAKIELKYNIEMSSKLDRYFSTTKEIHNFIQHEISK